MTRCTPANDAGVTPTIVTGVLLAWTTLPMTLGSLPKRRLQYGALMVATNVVNNALGVPLDDYLQPYRREPAAAAAEGIGAHG